eukprot:CAMPEP_0116846308 /NCGR_PEP_ID=MMETSP0418-20121206/13759_1 /TAXON_ID=1158023 /ORGANISM="Astrosyne radiata, Strain 13vi08-1A" /LENGTH=167 /DNA_ID=CAMNT_0004477533 /DNA_START=23 /DNA_END=526 /DNA_ORIENTATION=-
MDVENEKQPSVANPYSSALPEPRYDPFNTLYRICVIGGSLYILHRWELYETILHSPSVRHEWFKVGLAASIAILAIKAHVEMIEGKWKKNVINYRNYPQTTHSIMFLLVFASICFHVAIWPAYGSNSLIIMSIVGFGVLLHFALAVPTWAQNAIGVISMTWFLQEYV